MNSSRSSGFAFCAAASTALLLAWAAPRADAQGPVISEILAVNSGLFLDDDGESSDWIEIYNPGAATVNLSGWYLTDDPALPTKWRFPAVSLPAGNFLVVFASGKHRVNPAAPLHTNFHLSGETGEFLALLQPDGKTIASQFSPQFPPQFRNVSYGYPQDFTNTTLVASNAASRTLVPSDGSLGNSWLAVDFDDASWLGGQTGIGYDRNPDYGPFIKTNVRTQMDGINTSAYIRIEFDIADPAMFSSLKLRMLYDDGYYAYLNGSFLASRNAPATLAWNAEATALHDDPQAVIFEEENLGAVGGRLRAGKNILAIHGLNDNISSSDFLIMPELIAGTSGSMQTNVRHYFAAPTPGAPNGTGFTSVAPPPELSQTPRAFSGSLSLGMSVGIPGAVIRYTLDRSEPTATSTAYSTPISLTATTVVKAKTFINGVLPSATVTGNYFALAADARNFSSNLPIVIINTFGSGIGDNSRTEATVQFVDTAAGGRSAITGVPDFTGTAGIKSRGSSSAGFPKRSFALEIWDDVRNDRDVSILGFPPESDWILYAPYTDKALMRDVLSYDWSNQIGRYAVRCRFVEMFLNTGSGGQIANASNYWGVYVLMEKIKRGEDRVDIRKLLRSDSTIPQITGGYMIKKDRLDPGDSGFATNGGQRLAFVDPKERDISSAQSSWLKGYMDQFEAALFGANYRDPDIGYAKFIDVDSFIDHHIMVELTKNIDGFRLSTFYFKDFQGKLSMGPIWDYNLCLGNANYLQGWIPEGWYNTQIGDADYPWWRRMFSDPDFSQKWADRWAELRRGPFQASNLLSQIDAYAALLNEAQARNYQRWQILGTYVWPNWFIASSFQEEINWMKGWLQSRLVWIDSNYVTPPNFSRQGGPITPGFTLTLSAPAGVILYTLDGTDPRLPGGSLSASAQTYSGPITLDGNARVFARARVSTRWSGYNAATFVAETPPLVITELMYHPADPPDGSPYDADDFEFVEVQNIGTQSYDTAGVRFTAGVEFVFPPGPDSVLLPGEFMVAVKNLEAFQSRYGSAGIRIAGSYTGNFNNAGETVVLVGSLGEPLHEFTYSDIWYPSTDGLGPSLVINDPVAPRSTWNELDSWRPSDASGGTPGYGDVLDGGVQLPGDANQDGSLDISDAVTQLLRLFGGLSAPLPCAGDGLELEGNLALHDVNSDAKVDLSDVVYTLTYLFQKGPPPALGTQCLRMPGCPNVCGR